MEERARRDLGDCTPAHTACRAQGFRIGTPGYLGCREVIAQQDAINQQAWLGVAAQGLKMTQPRQNAPSGVSCVGNTMGNFSSATCQGF